MKSKNSLTTQNLKLLMLVAIMSVLFVSGVATTQAQDSSATNSQPSATPVPDDVFRRAVAEALEELRSARKLIEAQSLELKIKDELIALERQLSDGQKNLRTMDAAELAALRTALSAKERVIAAYEAEIVLLKKKRWSFWKVVKTAAVAGAAGLVVGAIVVNK